MVVAWDGNDNELIFQDEKRIPVFVMHKIDELFPA